MSKLRWMVSAAMFVAAASSAEAQTLDAQALKLYGGTYSTNCGNTTAPRLRVVADSLMVEALGKRLTGRNVQAAYSYFGQNPPPDYQVVLLSEVDGGSQLLFIVYRDKFGQFITLDGEPKVQAALGKVLLGQKYRNCDPARREVAAAPTASAAPADSTIGPPELLRDARFKALYHKALGSKVKEGWLAELDGPAPPVKKIKIAGTEYLLASACKTHDCGDNSTVILYSAAQGMVYGKIVEQRRATLIGAPSVAMAAELDRIWQAEWRQNR